MKIFFSSSIDFLSFLQIISLESWVNIMYYIQDAHSFWDWIYFVFLIIIGSFFMINLCLVVIATQFSETKKRETERMLVERRRFSRSSSTLLSDEPGSCWEETIKSLERLWKHARKRIAIFWKHYKRKHAKVRRSLYIYLKFVFFSSKANRKRLGEVKKHRRKNDKKASTLQIQIHSTTNSAPSSNLHIIHRPNCPLYQPAATSNVPTPSSMYLYSIDAPAASPEQSDIITPSPTVVPKINPHSPIGNSSLPPTLTPILSKTRSPKSPDVTEIICADVDTAPSAYNIVENLLDETMQKKPSIQFCECHREDISEDDDDDDDENESDIDNPRTKKEKKRSKLYLLCDQYCFSYVRKIHQFIKQFVASKYFRRIVLSAIVINTLSMGIEYHGQPDSLTNALEYSNIIFTILFACEMILKIIAEGFLKYIKNAYNLFDSGIVIMSIIELQGNKNSGLSVLRTFRLLRVLKLVRFMPTLRRQLVSQRRLLNHVENYSCLLRIGSFTVFGLTPMISLEGKLIPNMQAMKDTPFL